MGYQESFIYSKTGNDDDITRAIELIKKYKLYDEMPLWYCVDEVQKDISNGHTKKYPIINWKVGQRLISIGGERYCQRSVSTAFGYYWDSETKQSTQILTEEEHKFLNDNLELVFIDDWVDPLFKTKVYEKKLKMFQETFKTIDSIKDKKIRVDYYWYHHGLAFSKGSDYCEKINESIEKHDFKAFMEFRNELENKYKYDVKPDNEFYEELKDKYICFLPDIAIVFDENREFEPGYKGEELDITIEENFKKITHSEYECG